jgi:hypothetical protein
MVRNNIGIFDFIGSSGLRGDKEFKKELTDSFENFDFSSDPEFFNTSLDDNFMAIIKKGQKSNDGDLIYFKHYNKHGISAGCVNLHYYEKIGIPELKARYFENYEKDNRKNYPKNNFNIGNFLKKIFFRRQ